MDNKIILTNLEILYKHKLVLNLALDVANMLFQFSKELNENLPEIEIQGYQSRNLPEKHARIICIFPDLDDDKVEKVMGAYYEKRKDPRYNHYLSKHIVFSYGGKDE